MWLIHPIRAVAYHGKVCRNGGLLLHSTGWALAHHAFGAGPSWVLQRKALHEISHLHSVVRRANALMSLIISNVWKLLLVLMVIWEFFLDYAWAITVFVLASNVQALSGNPTIHSACAGNWLTCGVSHSSHEGISTNSCGPCELHGADLYQQSLHQLSLDANAVDTHPQSLNHSTRIPAESLLFISQQIDRVYVLDYGNR